MAKVVEMGFIMTALKSMIECHKKLSAHNAQIKFSGPIFKISILPNILKIRKLVFFEKCGVLDLICQNEKIPYFNIWKVEF